MPHVNRGYIILLYWTEQYLAVSNLCNMLLSYNVLKWALGISIHSALQMVLLNTLELQQNFCHLQTIFLNEFLQCKSFNFTAVCSSWSNRQGIGICSGNGLALNRQQIIPCTNDNQVLWCCMPSPTHTNFYKASVLSYLNACHQSHGKLRCFWKEPVGYSSTWLTTGIYREATGLLQQRNTCEQR